MFSYFPEIQENNIGLHVTKLLYKQPSCLGPDVKNGLKIKQHPKQPPKQPPTLKALLQK